MACAPTEGERPVFQPAEGLGRGRVVQGSTTCLVRLVDLSASAHQGHSALVPPISSRIVQRCPTGRMQGERTQSLWILVYTQHAENLAFTDERELTFPLCPSCLSRYRYLRASSDIQHFCEERRPWQEIKLEQKTTCDCIISWVTLIFKCPSRLCILPSRGSSV